MSDWIKFSDKKPTDIGPILVGYYDAVAILATYNPFTGRMRQLQTGNRLRQEFDVWMPYEPTVAPSAENFNGKSYDAQADVGEPSFTLVARDPIAPLLVEAWAYLRMGQFLNAQNSLNSVVNMAHTMEPQSSSDPQVMSAFRIAGSMLLWFRKKAARAKC